MKARLAIFSLLVLGLFAGTFMLYGKMEQRTKQDFHQIQANLFPASELAVEANSLFSQYDQQMNNAVILSEEENVEAAVELFNQMLSVLSDLEIIVDGAQKSGVSDLASALEQYHR
ncbi:hypothetical protein L4C33_17790, partial [Vibrio makurazakiensis]|uniref:hypothetical protein n=1 Tax=Vibrio makurazakiensis TaxID=2910250 RepID=UPI003D0982D6